MSFRGKRKSTKPRAMPSKYEKKHEVISFEDVTSNDIYAFTFNPCDEYQHFGDPRRIQLCINDMLTVLSDSRIYSLRLWPELSPKGRYHVHGFLRIIDPNCFYMFTIHSWLNKGTVVIKRQSEACIHDINGKLCMWEDYCKKQEQFHKYVIQKLAYKLPFSMGYIDIEDIPAVDPSELVLEMNQEYDFIFDNEVERIVIKTSQESSHDAAFGRLMTH